MTGSDIADFFQKHVHGLKIRGHEGYGRCPFHADRKASFTVNVETGLWTCHAGCGKGNVRQFAERLGVPVPDDRGPRHRTTRIVATYDYRDEHGTLLFQVVRSDPKDFRQRRPDANGGWIWNLDGVRRIPYRLAETVAAIERGECVFIVEGEKDADRLIAAGLAATTNPGGAGKWRADYAAYFKGAHAAVLPDNDPPGTGHAEQIAQTLDGVTDGVKIVTLPGLPPKGDVSDWLDQGHAVNELQRLAEDAPPWRPPGDHRDGPSSKIRPITITAAELMQKTLPEQRCIVPGLIGEGVSGLVSRPKIGKSWMLLQIAIAVANGGRVAGVPVKQGAALYLALEDTERRLQERIRRQLGGDSAPAALTLATTWPRLGAGCIEALEDWIAEHPDVTFIAIDTLAKIRPPRRPNGDKYAEDYAVIEAVKALADRYHIAIVLAHHDRKAEAEDPLDRVSGTIGLTGSLDTILLLKRARGQHDATLFVTGRDVDERELALRWDPMFGIWTIVGDAEDFRRSDERRQIINLLATRAPLKAKIIAAALDRKDNTTRWLLAEMVKAGEILSGKDGYTLPTPPTPSTPPTAPTPPTGPTKPESRGKVGRVGNRDDRSHRRRRPPSPKGQGVPQGVGGVGPVGSAEMPPSRGAKGKEKRSTGPMNGVSSGWNPAPADEQSSFVLAMGELLGYPRLEFNQGRAIAPGVESWRKFIDHASPADMALAVAVLLKVDTTAAGSDTAGDPDVGD